ncbi:FAD-dependent monooxygenase [Streptomyces sp. NPDC004610]|uniref:FAD-dependent monooxygenase n=1 Tax=unclassified Streptomyces TaxID=2593676 RepID=UPI0033B50529
MSLRARKKAIVVGAGIGGLAAAVALRKVGVDVAVYERDQCFRPAGSGISVMSNAVGALRALDIDLGLERRGQIVRRTVILDSAGRTMREMPPMDPAAPAAAPSVAMNRADLHEALMGALGDVPIELGADAASYEIRGGGVRVRFTDGREASGDILIGADGINSAIRRQRTGDIRKPRYGGFLCWLSIIPFSHPRMTVGFNAHYWGRGARFGLHDVGSGRVYWWGTVNMPADAARAWDGDRTEIARAYGNWADEVQDVILATRTDDIVAVPAQDRPFLETWGDGPVTLLGDAAHPMLPSLGQGASSAIEDAVVLAQCLAARENPVTALRAYEDVRREKSRQLVQASRKLGALEQVENPLRRVVRDTYIRWAPASALSAPFKHAATPQLLAE